jgi:hypothetical protein
VTLLLGDAVDVEDVGVFLVVRECVELDQPILADEVFRDPRA